MNLSKNLQSVTSQHRSQFVRRKNQKPNSTRTNFRGSLRNLQRTVETRNFVGNFCKVVRSCLWPVRNFPTTREWVLWLQEPASKSKLIRGQSYKTYYTFGQIYKPILKRDKMLWLRKYLVRLLGYYPLKYSWSFFFLRGAISNLGTTLRFKKFHRIGPWCKIAELVEKCFCRERHFTR